MAIALAKRLLTDTRLSVTEIAMIAGFGSIRRFNDLFKTHYRLTPKNLRAMGKTIDQTDGGITLTLGYRPPYDWNQLISFFAGRAIPGVESVTEQGYRRTVAIQKRATVHRGWIAIANMPEKNALSVTLAPTLLPVLSQVLALVKLLFDVNCSPMDIYEKLKIMNNLAPDLCVPGIRLPGCFDPFEMAVRAVLGQQATAKAARTLAMRFAATFGEKIETPFHELTYTFPGPDQILALGVPIEKQLGPLGIIRVRARSIFTLAEALKSGLVILSHSVDPENEMEQLLKLPGFGPWTVQYLGMRALAWPDAFPHTDYGIKKALPSLSPKEILDLSQSWRPWRSYAVINLWNALGKNDIH